VRIWIERLGYGYDIIDFAVRKVWEYQEPSVNKADAYLKSWYASGVRTLAEAQVYEQEQAKKNRQAYQRDKTQRPSGADLPKQNFTGVEYDEEFLKTLETDPEEYLKRLQRKNEERP
jgi:DNA replication protein DnaD